MDSVNQNKWSRPWTTDELKDNAENWSLAGDIALLNTIKAFSEKLLSKTGEISDKIDLLLSNVDEASLKLDLAQNEFQNLKNTQFIESRVYDDDEALDSKKEEKLIEKVIPEDEQEQLIINSIKKGMEILDEYYEKMEVSVSDSDEEIEKSNFCEYILKPKDMYAHRPLPPIIGTDEWYQKWHLDIPSSDSESDKVSDIYSESDSEDNLPKDFIKGSETSSELDFSSHASENRPVANSTFNSSQHVDVESSSMENEDQESLTDKTSLTNKSFAEQLAAKLGTIISEQEVSPEEINKRQIQPPKPTNVTGMPFEEPPPLDEFENSILPKNIQTGYFSGGQGLFDDDNDDDEPFWGQSNKTEFTNKAVADEPKKQSSKVSKGLFDESGSDDDDGMFTTTKRSSIDVNKYLQPKKLAVELYDEEPPELKEPKGNLAAEKDKKPVGGVRLMGSVDIFNDQKISKILKSSSTGNNEKIEETPKTILAKEEIVSTKPKRKNLFDEDEDFDDFLGVGNKIGVFSSEKAKIKENNKRSNLFDDEELEEQQEEETDVKPNTEVKSSENLLGGGTSGISSTNKKSVKKISLFDDGDDNEEEIIVNKSKKVNRLFDDDDELFNNDDDFFSNIANTKLSSKLFDEIEEKSDDMFDIKSKPTNMKKDLFSEDSDFEYGVADKKNVEKSVSSNNELDFDKTKDITTIKTDNPKDDVKEIKVEPTVGSPSVIKKEENGATGIRKSDDIFLNTESSKQKTAKVAKKTLSLFDDSDSENDGIFKNDNNNSTSEIDKIESGKRVVAEIDNDTTKNLKSEENTSPNHQGNGSYTNISTKPEIPPPVISEQKTMPAPDKEKPANLPISPFDTVPPPEDVDDWDTKSDSVSDGEEYVPYQPEENFSRSSVFDDEPPSLGPNESSGIVRDYSTTRTETDDSSFLPHASSSRRLSSDIFNDQESQDNFFVTKNKTESFNSTNLGVIPEVVTQSNITDITPSGDIKAFDSTLESQTSKEDLHREEKENNTTVEDEMLKRSGNGTSENVLSRIAVFEQSRKGDGQAPAVEPKGSPGKLKHNLNINVNALRPTLGPPLLKFRPKSLSFPDDETDSDQLKPQKTLSFSNIPKVVTICEPSKILDDGGEQKIEVLHSITKDRVKIPVKRRPSTRKGRLEAIRRSAADLPFHDDNYGESENNTAASSTNTDQVKKESSHDGKINETDRTSAEDTLKIEHFSAMDIKPIEIRRAKITSTKRDTKLPVESPKTPPLLDETKITKIREKSPIKNPVNNKDSDPIEGPKLVTKTTKINQGVKKLTRLFDDVGFDDDDDLFQSSVSAITKTEDSNISGSAEEKKNQMFKTKQETATVEDSKGSAKEKEENSKPDKRISKLFSGSEDELFSNLNWVKTKREIAVTNRDPTTDSVQPKEEISKTDKRISKLFSGSEDELFSNLNWVKTKKEIATTNTDSTSYPPSNEESIKPPNKRIISKLFSGTEDEIFSSTSKVVVKNDKDDVRDSKNIPHHVVDTTSSPIKKIISTFNDSDEKTTSSGAHSPKVLNKITSKVVEESKQQTKKLFNESDDEMFASNASRTVAKKKSGRLFGSDDDESDGELFQNSSSGKVAEQKQHSKAKTTVPKTLEQFKKKSLFNDSSSDDDLFSTTNKKTGRTKEPTLKTPKPHGFKKSENKETTEDPLSKLF